MGDNKNKTKEGRYGQFFTNEGLCDNVLSIVNKIKPISGDILEPSFGTGNFIDSIKKYKINSITGIEIDDTLFKSWGDDRIHTLNVDFIDFENQELYDFIIGNPPYIEVCYSFYDKVKQNILKKRFKTISNGRMNLVHIFMEKSFNMVKNDGIIAFLLPSSILTSPVYKHIRKKIHDEFVIEHLIEDVKFEGVMLKVCLLVIRKGVGEKKYFKPNDDNYFILTDYVQFEGTTTLKDKGFNVNIGDVIWNNNVDKLSDNFNDKVLVYSHNIKNDELQLDNNKRPQYINGVDVRFDNCIVLPRTITKKIRFHFIENNDRYVFENHVLVISHPDVKLLKELYGKLKGGYYNDYMKSFFNSSNLTKGEVLSLPF